VGSSAFAPLHDLPQHQRSSVRPPHFSPRPGRQFGNASHATASPSATLPRSCRSLAPNPRPGAELTAPPPGPRTSDFGFPATRRPVTLSLNSQPSTFNGPRLCPRPGTVPLCISVCPSAQLDPTPDPPYARTDESKDRYQERDAGRCLRDN
jgi:hypothetical protein